MVDLGNKDIKKTATTGAGFLLMYSGFTLLLLPMIISTWPLYLNLYNTPLTFSFEGDLSSISSISGTPLAVISPAASGMKAIECQNGDHIRWDLATSSKTIDLTFKIYCTRLPTISNESLTIGEIWMLDAGKWRSILSTSLYCNQNGFRGWSLWTSINNGHGGFVAGDVVYGLKTNRWYAIRMTADLCTGTFRLYMDGTELSSIMNVEVPEDVSIDFFRLGAGVRGDSIFKIYYDDVTVSLLSPSPPPHQWSIRITSSSGGSTKPYSTVNVNNGERLIVTAIQAPDYIFSKWTFDGMDYSINSTFTVSAQVPGTQHTLHATFTNANPNPYPEIIWLFLQVIGLCLIGGGGCLLWSRKKRESIMLL